MQKLEGRPRIGRFAVAAATMLAAIAPTAAGEVSQWPGDELPEPQAGAVDDRRGSCVETGTTPPYVTVNPEECVPPTLP